MEQEQQEQLIIDLSCHTIQSSLPHSLSLLPLNLKCLIITNSNLHTIPLGLPSSLQELDLSHNCITHIDNVSHMKYLQTLCLDYNNITDFSGCCFDRNVHLRELGLAYNKLTTIPNNVGNLCKQLVLLDLSGNSFTFEKIRNISMFVKLKRLYLEDTHISKKASYRIRMAQLLPRLQQLDGKNVLRSVMKRSASPSPHKQRRRPSTPKQQRRKSAGVFNRLTSSTTVSSRAKAIRASSSTPPKLPPSFMNTPMRRRTKPINNDVIQTLTQKVDNLYNIMKQQQDEMNELRMALQAQNGKTAVQHSSSSLSKTPPPPPPSSSSATKNLSLSSPEVVHAIEHAVSALEEENNTTTAIETLRKLINSSSSSPQTRAKQHSNNTTQNHIHAWIFELEEDVSTMRLSLGNLMDLLLSFGKRLHDESLYEHLKDFELELEKAQLLKSKEIPQNIIQQLNKLPKSTVLAVNECMDRIRAIQAAVRILLERGFELKYAKTFPQDLEIQIQSFHDLIRPLPTIRNTLLMVKSPMLSSSSSDSILEKYI